MVWATNTFRDDGSMSFTIGANISLFVITSKISKIRALKALNIGCILTLSTAHG